MRGQLLSSYIIETTMVVFPIAGTLDGAKDSRVTNATCCVNRGSSNQ